jgi:predicted peptidase
MHYLITCCFALVGTVVLSAQEKTDYLSRTFVNQGGDTLFYRILLPADYDSGKRYPMLLFLHGAGERGDDNVSQLIHGSKLFANSQVRAQFPAIVVFPQCPKTDYWAQMTRNEARTAWSFPFSEQPERAMGLVVQLVEHLKTTEKVDTRRMYVSGLSMGGMGTFELLARLPGEFAAAVPICGGGNPLLVPLYAKNTALWIFHGSADTVVPVELSQKMAEAAKRAGGKVRYTEYAGINHDSWTPAFSEPDLLKWLFSQKRKK